VTPAIFLGTFAFFSLLLRKQTGIQNKSYMCACKLMPTLRKHSIVPPTVHVIAVLNAAIEIIIPLQPVCWLVTADGITWIHLDTTM